MESIMNINAAVNNFVWGPVMLALIVGVGIYFSVRLKFLQFAKFGAWNKMTLGRLFKGEKAAEGSVTPFQAFCTAMAATAGVGNLVGVTGAIILGGPGAMFWMFVAGVLGMATKYVEIVLAIQFRKRNDKGEWVGGPMYYITEGLGPKFKWLAIAFSIFGALCAFGIGNMTQINAAVGTAEQMLVDLNIMSAAEAGGYSPFKVAYGFILAVCVGLVIVGGFKRIGNAAEILVPFAGLFCIIGSIVAICLKAEQIGPAFMLIINGAFSPQALGGGILGYTIILAVRFGVARGVFTNEAGLGSAPIAHAAADVDHPVKQGVWGCFEVFADTLVMCTLTAFVVLTSGVIFDPATGLVTEGITVMDGKLIADASQIVSAAYKASFGVAGSIFMAVCVLIFAYCTTLSWSLYGLRCFQFLTKGKGSESYMLVFTLCVIVAAIMKLSFAWDIADTLNGLMAIPNLIALIALSGVVFKLTKEFFSAKKLDAGK